MDVKKWLLDDVNRMVNLLENLGCHKINSSRCGYITCARPNGDNPVGISVKLNESLTTKMFTDTDDVNDIIGLVMYLKKVSFKEAIKFINSDLKYEKSVVDSLSIFNKKEIEVKSRTFLDENYLYNFKPYVVQEWIKEGITTEIQNKYDIRIDEKSERYLIPVRDENNNLVSIKGRTYKKDYRIFDIPKYIYYTKLHYNDVLFGLNYNKENIKKRKEVIIFEGEKSVMKAESYGFNNCVSIGMAHINTDMLKKILQLNVDVVLCFDKGLKEKQIKSQIDKLKMFTNVYVVEDSENITKDKDSPIDNGIETWIKLYNSKRKVVR